jgi:2-polyprenyl-6-hydroxyphenyl methylase / 3-demethylubiquinone-9 3-methyltransferase
MVQTSIVPEEAAQFGRLAGDWWDPNGASAMLHKLNPVRLAYVRDMVDQHWQVDEQGFKPLAGKTALDVGCGAGLLAEPLARLGAKVTAVDAAPELIEVAKAHAAGQGLDVDYRVAGVEAVSGKFDLVTAMEVIEHVADKPAFVAALAASVAPGGLVVLSTPNRTPQARLLLVRGAEALGAIPKGTHHWDDFVTPDELRSLLAAQGLEMGDPCGIAYSPGKGLHLSASLALNYIVSATPR